MNMKTTLKFKDLLAKYRDRENLSKTDIAQKIDVTVSYIIDIEAGRKKPPTLEKCQKLIEVLKLTAEEAGGFIKSALYERASKEILEFLKLQSELKDLFVDKAIRGVSSVKEDRNTLFVQVPKEFAYIIKKHPEIFAAIQDPIAINALLITFKNTQDIKNTIKALLETIPSLTPEKRRALLALCR